AVAARDLDQPRRLEDEMPLLALGGEAVGRAAWNDDVVAVPVRDVAEDRLQRARSLVDEDDLVTLAVPVEALHGLRRTAERDLDVLVPHQQPSARDLVALGRDVPRPEVTVRVCVRHPLVALDRLEL